jgi:hypothetical protein
MHMQGLRGIRALGVRDMTYRLAFLCCNAQNRDDYYGSWNIREDQVCVCVRVCVCVSAGESEHRPA